MLFEAVSQSPYQSKLTAECTPLLVNLLLLLEEKHEKRFKARTRSRSLRLP